MENVMLGSSLNEAAMDVERYRKQLQTLERELRERIGREVGNARQTQDDQKDTSDESVVDELRGEAFAMADTDSAVLKEVEAALERIDDGTFGKCLADGGPIEPKRLDAVPWTRYCVKHQQQFEEAAGLKTPKL
jgi:DnaK suppressor protein